jgi:uncharacterized protein (TIGR00730 family)
VESDNEGAAAGSEGRSTAEKSGDNNSGQGLPLGGRPLSLGGTPSQEKPIFLRRGAFGDPRINAAIEECVALAKDPPDHQAAPLIAEMIAAVLRMYRDEASIADLKLVLAAIKELRYTSRIFRQYREVPKVAIFGTARASKTDPEYVQAKEFARRIADRGWMVITGGGPGVMAAGNEGAGSQRSFGLRIRLPSEPGANRAILGDPKLLNYKYFFTRKVTFVKEAHAFVLMPGGFGTLDETFELLTLMQTGRSDLHPVVLLEPPETRYWEGWLEFLEREVLERGFIDRDDLDLFDLTHDVEDAVEILERFYRVYHSQRYVNGRLILRLKKQIAPEYVSELSRKYAFMLSNGHIEIVPPTPEEIQDNDFVDLPRLALWFDRKHFSALRKLIDDINRAPAF